MAFQAEARAPASGSHLDLSRAPYVLYGVKYIDPATLCVFAGHGFDSTRNRVADCAQVCLDLNRAPCIVYGVEYISLVSLVPTE